MKKKNCIYIFDLLGQHYSLYALGENRKKTLFGIFMTLILIIIILVLSIILISDWIYGNNMSINFSLYTILNNKSIFFNISKLVFCTNFNIEKEFNLTFYYKNEYEEIFELKYHVIKNDSNELLYSFEEKNFIFFNNIFKDTILLNSQIFINISSGYIFENEKLLNKYSINPPQITFFFNNPSFQHSNRRNPIQTIGIQFTSVFHLNYITSYNYSFIFAEYHTDDGYFFNKKKDYNLIILNENPLITSYVKYNSSNYFGLISLYLSPYNAELFERRFTKFHEVISNIGGIISLLKIIFETIIELFITKFFNYNLIKEIIKLENNTIEENYSVKNKNITIYKSLNEHSQISVNKLKESNNIVYLPKIKYFKYMFNCNKKYKLKSFFKLIEKFIKTYLCCENLIINNCWIKQIIQNLKLKENNTIKNFFVKNNIIQIKT